MPRPPVSHCPEIELLLRCARTRPSDGDAARIRELTQPDLDWAYLVRMAVRHRLTALLHRSLSSICPERVPPATLVNLQHHVHCMAVQNLSLTQELLNLLDLLDSQGIRAIPFKGPMLTAAIYNNATLRRFGDLDILVHEQDFWKTRDVLLTQGYRPAVDPWFNNEGQEAAYFQSRNECALIREDGNVSIDLHRRLAAGDFFLMPFDFEGFWEFDRLWQRLEPVMVCNRAIASLCPEDLLLFLCVHGSKHLWERLSWVCDIAELIRSYPGLDWSWIFDQADQLRCDRTVTLALHLAHHLLDAPLPDIAHHRIQSSSVIPDLTRQVYRWLFSEAGAPPKGFSGDRIRFHLQEMHHRPDQITYAIRSLGHYGLAPLRRAMMPTLNDRQFLSLPPWLSGAYYLVRPVRLLVELGAKSAQMLISAGRSGRAFVAQTSCENKRID